MLVRCLYASRSVGQISTKTVEAILEQSRRNNARFGITGMLFIADDMFIQVLEGGRASIGALLNRIMRDERHERIEILLFDEIFERQFANWTMGWIDLERCNQALLLKYSEKAEIDPFASSGEATMALLTELVELGLVKARVG